MPRSKERLDRKQLKQDKLLNVTSQAMDYAGTHANIVLGVAAGVVLVIVLGVFWSRNHAERGAASDVRLSQVVGAYTAQQYEPAIQLATTLQSEYGGTSAALLATYIAGQSQLQLGKLPEAEQSFRTYLASASKAPFYEQPAQRALAASLEAQRKYAEAASLYLEVSAKQAEPLASQSKLDAARALRLAGSYEQAKSVLQGVAAANVPESYEAKIELAVVENSQGTPPASTPPATPAPPAPAPAK